MQTKPSANQLTGRPAASRGVVATTTKVSLNNAPSTVGGIALNEHDRVLVHLQSKPKQNSTYQVMIPGTGRSLEDANEKDQDVSNGYEGVFHGSSLGILGSTSNRADHVTLICPVAFEINSYIEIFIRYKSGNHNAIVKSLQVTAND